MDNYRYIKNYHYICRRYPATKIIRINKKSKVLTAKDDIMMQFAPGSMTIGQLPDSEMLSILYPPVGEACELTLLCRPGQFCASEIARAVEDCDAHLLNLNVTSLRSDDGDNVVALRVSHANGLSVARSLERYGYEVTAVNDSNGANAEVMRERIDELLHYLEV